MPHVDLIINGEKWPSATQLTSLLPQPWKWKWYQTEVKKHGWRGWQRCIAVSNRAMKIGTHVHGLVEAEFNGTLYVGHLTEPIRRQKLIVRLAECAIKEMRDDKVVSTETHVQSTEHRLHGTIDYVVQLADGSLSIDDLKTSSSMSSDYPIQLAIYAMGWNEEHADQQIQHGRIRRVDKKAKTPYVQTKEFKDLHYYYPVVQALRVIFDYVNGTGPWSKPEC